MIPVRQKNVLKENLRSALESSQCWSKKTREMRNYGAPNQSDRSQYFYKHLKLLETIIHHLSDKKWDIYFSFENAFTFDRQNDGTLGKEVFMPHPYYRNVFNYRNTAYLNKTTIERVFCVEQLDSKVSQISWRFPLISGDSIFWHF